MTKLTAIIGKEFPDKVIPLIDDAKKSIEIIVFDWRWYPNDPACAVQLFNQSIIRATRRGVKVRAIVNNDEMLKILNANGVKARKVKTTKLVHAKVMIIDDQHFVLGSHNYSQYAFTQNYEVSLLASNCDESDLDLFPIKKFFEAMYNV